MTFGDFYELQNVLYRVDIKRPNVAILRKTTVLSSTTLNLNNFGKVQKSHHPQSPQISSVCVAYTSSVSEVVVVGVCGLSLRRSAWFSPSRCLVGLVYAGAVGCDSTFRKIPSTGLYKPEVPSDDERTLTLRSRRVTIFNNVFQE